MLDWRIATILIVILLLGLTYPWARHFMQSWIWMRRMKAEGRWMPKDEVIQECEQGLGTLVHNEWHDLPYEWWYLRKTDRSPDQDLTANLENHGYIVEFENQQERDEMAGYKYKFQFEELVEHPEG